MSRVAFLLARIASYGFAIAPAAVALAAAAFAFLVGLFAGGSPVLGVLSGAFFAIPAMLPAWAAWHFFNVARTARLEDEA